MIHAIASEKLTIPYVIPVNIKCNRYELPSANCIQLKVDNEVVIQRSILHLVTTPELRAVHTFHFKEDHTEWNVFEPYQSPLSIQEVRGMMVYAIRQFRDPTFLLTQTKIKSNSFIRSAKPIIHYLESLHPEDKIYIILIFKYWSYAIGNYFDETSICRALLEYRPRKAESVIRNMGKDNHLFIPKTEDRNQPKSVRFSVFNL